MWFDNNIFEADTTEDQSGTPMEKVHNPTSTFFIYCGTARWEQQNF